MPRGPLRGPKVILIIFILNLALILAPLGVWLGFLTANSSSTPQAHSRHNLAFAEANSTIGFFGRKKFPTKKPWFIFLLGIKRFWKKSKWKNKCQYYFSIYKNYQGKLVDLRFRIPWFYESRIFLFDQNESCLFIYFSSNWLKHLRKSGIQGG